MVSLSDEPSRPAILGRRDRATRVGSGWQPPARVCDPRRRPRI